RAHRQLDVIPGRPATPVETCAEHAEHGRDAVDVETPEPGDPALSGHAIGNRLSANRDGVRDARTIEPDEAPGGATPHPRNLRGRETRARLGWVRRATRRGCLITEEPIARKEGTGIRRGGGAG